MKRGVLMKKKNTIRCPYCGANAKLRPASVVYGEMTLDNHAYVYVCDRYPACDAYVGAHAESKLPMGTLANGDLRNKRIRAHRAFDQLWKSGRMTKKEAYRWLQMQFGLPREQAHIAMFGEYMCERVIRECTQKAEKMMIAI